MTNKNKRCSECGKPLRPSQYLKLKKEGEAAVKTDENLVCRNYPACKKAEKEIQKS